MSAPASSLPNPLQFKVENFKLEGKVLQFLEEIFKTIEKEQGAFLRTVSGYRDSPKKSSLGIKGTPFSLDIEEDGAYSWVNRKLFITNSIKFIIEKFNSKEPITLISQGSCFALTEIILFNALIKAGYEHASLFLIDPLYEREKAYAEMLLQHLYIQALGTIPESKRGLFKPERIQMFSRTHECFSFLPDQQNIVVIECAPEDAVYSETVKKFRFEIPPRNELFFSGAVTSARSANAIVLLPTDLFKNSISDMLKRSQIPVAIIQIAKEYCVINSGCSLSRFGQFSIKLSSIVKRMVVEGIDQFNSDRTALYSLKNIPFEEFSQKHCRMVQEFEKKLSQAFAVVKLEVLIERDIHSQIAKIRKGRPTAVSRLNQNDIFRILETVRATLSKSVFLDQIIVNTANPGVDQSDLLEQIQLYKNPFAVISLSKANPEGDAFSSMKFFPYGEFFLRS